MVDTGIYSARELEARIAILHHTYSLKIDAESKILADMTISKILPAAIDYMNKLAANVAGLKEAGISATLLKGQ